MPDDAQYGTPNAISPQTWAYHCLRVPTNLRPQIVGAIASLFSSENWYDDGDLSIDDAVQLCLEMFSTFERRCAVQLGEIITVAIDAASLPAHLLPCDGAWYDKDDYPDLYAIVASQFKNATQVRTPDLRARTIVGVGTNGTLTNVVMNSAFGLENEQVNIAYLEKHTHVYNRYGTAFILAGELAPVQVVVPPLTSTPSTSQAGGDVPHSNFQPSLGLQYAMIAKYPTE